MDDFLEDRQSGRIQFRDKWQFELKTELFPFSHLPNNIYSQEFYFFIPNSLQINEQTYSKAQFYQDQTNMIRFKTPIFTFQELNDPENSESPFVRILLISDYVHTPENGDAIYDEVKLLGNVFHSTLRNQIVDFMEQLDALDSTAAKNHFALDVEQFCDELQAYRQRFFDVKKKCLDAWGKDLLGNYFEYVDEFISLNMNEYLLGLLNRMRKKQYPELEGIDKRLCDIILVERKYREERYKEPSRLSHDQPKDEFILYRKGLLNKFVIDPLLLKTSRASIDQRFRGVILGIPAAIAMMLFMLLYVWQGNVFLINSEPFIVLTVIIYVLKDRLKEELRLLSYRKAAKWFSDYTTEIQSPTNGSILGFVDESFSFVNAKKVPEEIINIRNREFHGVLETFKRPEQIIYYKKTVNIKKKPKKIESRFYGFSILFRFDIHHFLTKAENAYQSTLSLDPDSLILQRVQLPRVYHLNMIIKNTMMMPEGDTRVELKKFRLVLDKNGIKRIESF